MVQDSHCCGFTEIMGLESSLSELPQQQLLKAASHLQHQGAEQAPDSYTSLKPRAEIVWLHRLLYHFIEMFRWAAMKSLLM